MIRIDGSSRTHSFKVTLTSVGLLNDKDLEIAEIQVENDYDIDSRTNQQGLRLDYDPNVEYNARLVITLKAAKQDVKFPKSIRLFVRGCGRPVSLVTKAQVEEGIHISCFVVQHAQTMCSRSENDFETDGAIHNCWR